jgi:hypothetical protein
MACGGGISAPSEGRISLPANVIVGDFQCKRLVPCGWDLVLDTVPRPSLCRSWLSVASCPPGFITGVILVLISEGVQAKFPRAPHPCSCTPALCACVCMAATTASMPPALAILVLFSACEAAKCYKLV